MDTLLLGLEVFPVCLVLTLMATQVILPKLQKAHAGQCILEIGPAWHKSKEGTPTMGGIAPMFAVVCSTAAFAVFLSFRMREDITPWLCVLVFALANACVGIIDDVTKIRKARNLGLTPLQKLALQSAIALGFLFLIQIHGIASTDVTVPFVNITWHMGWFWYPFFFLVIIWFVNCANLTDGVDGLAASVNGWIGIFYVFMACKSHDRILALVASALAGGAFGFFAFNRHPAKIFMGDTGSLFFGGLVVGCALISSSPLILFLIGMVFLLEGVSVVLQVTFFKLTHGKRLFRMAPLHHHLEKCGMGEWAITLLCSFITILCGLIAYWGISYAA